MAEGVHHLNHIEFLVRDLDRAKAFYGRLFDWQFSQFTPTMVVFGTDAGHIGGFQQAESFTPGDTPSVWFQVAEIEPLIQIAGANGGTLIEPKGEVPGVGWSAQITDPDGNRVGFVQYAS